MEDIYGTMGKMRDGSYLEKCAECKLVNRIPGMHDFTIEKEAMCRIVGAGDQYVVHPLKWSLEPVNPSVEALKYNGKPYTLESIGLDTLDRTLSTQIKPDPDQIKAHLEDLHLLMRYMSNTDGHKLLIIVPFGIHKEGRHNDLLGEKLAWPIKTGIEYYASHRSDAAVGAKNYCDEVDPPNAPTKGALPMHLLFEHLARGNHFYASTHSIDQRVLWFKESPIRVDLGEKYEGLIRAYAQHKAQDEWAKEFAPIAPSTKRGDWTRADYRSSSKVIDLSELGTKRMRCHPLRLGPKQAVSRGDGEIPPAAGASGADTEAEPNPGGISSPVWPLAATLIVLVVALVALLYLTDLKKRVKGWF